MTEDTLNDFEHCVENVDLIASRETDKDDENTLLLVQQHYRTLIAEVRKLTRQRNQLAEIARRWCPNNDDGMSHHPTMGFRSPTHVVDRIIGE